MSESSKIYEIIESLGHPVLYNSTHEAIDALSEKDLIQLSKDIAEFHNKNVPSVIQNLRQRKKEFNSYPINHNPHETSLLRPMALYSEQVVIRDPIADSFSNPAYSTPNVDAIKSSLNSAVSTLLEIEPLVRIGIVQLVPFYALQESLIETVNQKVDEDLKDGQWKGTIVKGIKYKLYPDQNTLLLSLGPPASGSYMCFKYARSLPESLKEDDKSVVVEMVIPDSLTGYPHGITESDINSWIDTEINNEVFRTTEKINQNLLLAEALNTSIVTNNDVYDSLLSLKVKNAGKANADSKAISSILKFTVPFVDNLPFEKIAELREKEKDSFLDLQMLLRDLSRKIEYSSPADLQEQAQKIASEEVSPLLRKLNREFDRIRKSAIIRSVPRAAIAFGTIAVSVASGTPLIMALGSIASLKLFKDVSDEYASYLEKELSLKDNSAYFLWKVSKTSIDANGKQYRRHVGFPEKIIVDSNNMAKKMGGLGIKLYPKVIDKSLPEDNSSL